MAKQRKGKDKDGTKPGRLVWRISAAAPLGEFVHPEPPTRGSVPADAKAASDAKQAEIPERGWHHSSHDLHRGMDLREDPLESLPDELFDQLFRKPKK